MKEHRLRVLVIAGDPDRIQLLEEAFTEMEELRFTKPAYLACQRDYALDWHEALDTLRRLDGEHPAAAPPHDVILLDLSCSDEAAPPAHAAFTALRAAAPPAAAIVLLAPPGGEAAALALIRMGAQDYLTETDIDCAPLARLLRCAVERSRFTWSHQSVSMVDDLTGLYNRHGIAALSWRDERLAATLGLHRWSVDVRLLAATPPGAGDDDSQDAGLRRLKLAEQLSDLTSAGPVAGRSSTDEFILFGLAGSPEEATASAMRAVRVLRERCLARGIPVQASSDSSGGHAIGSGHVSLETLCENR